MARKFKATTDSKHLLPVFDNLLQQDFSATAPNRKWAGDMTYLLTDEGWLRLPFGYIWPSSLTYFPGKSWAGLWLNG